MGPSTEHPGAAPDPRCLVLRDELLAGLTGLHGEPPSEALEAHLADCDACRATRARGLAQTRALLGLRPLSAPVELEARVARVLTAGDRQDRALRHLAQLAASPAPADLDVRLDRDLRGGRPRTPAVLDRLVGEALEDLPREVTRRMLGRLPRLSAPAVLDQRVAAEARRVAAGSRGAMGRRPRTSLAAPTGLALAATLVLVLTRLGGTSDPRPGGEPAVYSFEVVHVDAPHASAEDAATLRILNSLTGGALRPPIR